MTSLSISLSRLLLAFLTALSAFADAAPLDAGGRSLTGFEVTGESPQSREYRAGLQAQINNKPSIAKARYEAALKLDPKYAPALIGLAALALAQGNGGEAEKFLQQAEQVAPNAPEVQLAWGRYAVASGSFERAERYFRKANELAPSQIPPLLELGDLYLRGQGKQEDAIKAYRAALAINSGNPFAHYGLGVALAAAGRGDEALVELRRASELAPKDPAPFRAIGRLHLEAGEPEKALVAFDAGLSKQPKFVPLMLDRADALGNLFRWNDAIRQLQTADKLVPESADIKIKLGDANQGASRWAEAETNYLQAIKLAPKNPLPYNNLAWMMVERKGDSNKAIQLAQQAVKLSPQSSPFHDTLGWAERAAGNLPSALSSFRRAIELEPKVALYHFHAGLVLNEMSKPVEARSALSQALELKLARPQADEAKRIMKAL